MTRIATSTDASIRRGRLGLGMYTTHPQLNMCLAGRVLNCPQKPCSTLGETTAVLFALSTIPRHLPLTIYTDSMTTVEFIRRNRCPDRFRGQLRAIQCAIHARDLRTRVKTRVEWVKGHSNCYGNDVADKMSRLGTKIDLDTFTNLIRVAQWDITYFVETLERNNAFI